MKQLSKKLFSSFLDERITLTINTPEFGGETFTTETFFKQIEKGPLMLEFEGEVELEADSEGWFEEVNYTLTSIKVKHENETEYSVGEQDISKLKKLFNTEV